MSARLADARQLVEPGSTPPPPAAHRRHTLVAVAPAAVSTGSGCGALLRAYRGRGGTARSDDIARRFRPHQRDGGRSLAQLLDHGEVFGFPWRQTLWIPMFQFNPGELSGRPGLRPVLDEWRGVFDGADIAAWFVDDNSWLGGDKPIDRLGTEPGAVLDAARADRFIAAG